MARSIAMEFEGGLATRQGPRGWPAFVRRRLGGRPDSEHEIFVNRLVLSWGIAACLVAASAFGHAGAKHLLDISSWMFWVYNLMGAALFAHLLAWPGISPFRRCAGICIDFWIIAAFDHIGGSSTAFMYPLYLWTIFGNGFRFGIPYLAIAAVAGLAAFGSVVLTGSYWLANPNVAAGLAGGLVLLPAYVGILIRKLSIAKRQAEEANKAKSMFLASVSHELRTPLTAIIGLTDLLQDTKLSRDQADMAQTVGSAGRGLLGLINSILDVSRTEMGKAPVGMKRLDLHALLAQTHAMLSVEASRKGIGLALHISARTPRFIVSSERHLQEVLVNLASNAVKFTNCGHVLIFADLAGARDGILRLRFEVEDSGIGIAEEAQGRIFETFTQADETIIDRFGGTGLGLAISRQLVESLSGTIGVVSAKGRGSTFWFEIDARIDAPVESTGAPGQLDASFEPGCVVLAVSGDRKLQASIERLGAQAAMVATVAEAKTGICGIRAGGGYRPVVLLDQGTLGRELETAAAELATGNLRDSPILIAVAAGADPDILSREGLRLFTTCLPRPLAGTPLRNILEFAGGHPAKDGSAEPGGNGKTWRPARILLAEDNPTNQKVITRILEKAGHFVEVVCNGEEALDALHERDFQIVLMDINMPVLNGIEAAKLYRFGQIDGPRVPIVALTADASEASRLRCLEAGMEACLTKPIDAAGLMATIEALASRGADPAGGQSDAAGAAASQGAPAQAATADALDLRALADLEALGGVEFVDEIVTQFTADAAAVLKSLAEAIRDGDVETFKDQAHALRSCAANVGAHRVYMTCLAWRDIERPELVLRGARYFDTLAGELAEARVRLADHLAARGPVARARAAGKPQLRLVS